MSGHPFTLWTKLLTKAAFAGKTDLPLAPLPNGFSGTKDVATYRQNLELVNQQLAAFTAAGWELVQVSTTIRLGGHTNLFRRPKNKPLSRSRTGQTEKPF